MSEQVSVFEFEVIDPNTGDHLGRMSVPLRQIMENYQAAKDEVNHLRRLNEDRAEVFSGLHQIIKDFKIDAPAGTRIDVAIRQYIEQLSESDQS